MTHTKLLISILALLLLGFSACTKEKDEDLTTGIVGFYTSGSGSGKVDITVTKVDNTTISIAIDPATSGIKTFSSTEMNSPTTFTLNSMSLLVNGERIYYTGTGSYSANNIIIQIHEKAVNPSTEAVLWEDDDTYTGTK